MVIENKNYCGEYSVNLCKSVSKKSAKIRVNPWFVSGVALMPCNRFPTSSQRDYAVTSCLAKCNLFYDNYAVFNISLSAL